MLKCEPAAKKDLFTKKAKKVKNNYGLGENWQGEARPSAGDVFLNVRYYSSPCGRGTRGRPRKKWQ